MVVVVVVVVVAIAVVVWFEPASELKELFLDSLSVYDDGYRQFVGLLLSLPYLGRVRG